MRTRSTALQPRLLTIVRTQVELGRSLRKELRLEAENKLLRAEGSPIGIASIYRSLEQLTRDGFLQRVEVGAPTARYEPVQPDGEHHQTHRYPGRPQQIRTGLSSIPLVVFGL